MLRIPAALLFALLLFGLGLWTVGALGESALTAQQQATPAAQDAGGPTPLVIDTNLRRLNRELQMLQGRVIVLERKAGIPTPRTGPASPPSGTPQRGPAPAPPPPARGR